MFIPSTDEMMLQILGTCTNPMYLKGYEEGYEQAKREMTEFIKNMQALYDTSTTCTGGTHDK